MHPYTHFRYPLVSLSPCLSLPLCLSWFHFCTHITHIHNHTQPEAIARLFMHLSCSPVSLCALLPFQPNPHMHAFTLVCRKSSGVAHLLVFEGMEICVHVKDEGSLNITIGTSQPPLTPPPFPPHPRLPLTYISSSHISLVWCKPQLPQATFGLCSTTSRWKREVGCKSL